METAKNVVLEMLPVVVSWAIVIVRLLVVVGAAIAILWLLLRFDPVVWAAVIAAVAALWGWHRAQEIQIAAEDRRLKEQHYAGLMNALTALTGDGSTSGRFVVESQRAWLYASADVMELIRKMQVAQAECNGDDVQALAKAICLEARRDLIEKAKRPTEMIIDGKWAKKWQFTMPKTAFGGRKDAIHYMIRRYEGGEARDVVVVGTRNCRFQAGFKPPGS